MQANAVQTWEPIPASDMRWCVRLFPSLTDLAFILPAFLLFAFMNGSARLLMDGDTGWHIRTGEWILQHGAVPRTDLFSFTKPHEAWFAWEWGWDVLFAGIHGAWGLAGVVFVNTCILCAVSALSFRLIRRCCGDDVLSLAFALLAMCGSTIHWLARPHLFSWVLVLVFLHVLLSAEQGNVKLLWWLPVLTIVWTNVHGGFFVGIALIAISACGELCKVIFQQESWASAYRNAKRYLFCAALCGAATLVNPYGWRLHEHIFSYLRDSKLLDHISEYQSISFHHGGALFFECMLMCGVGAIWWCVRNGKFAAGLLILVFGHLALVSGRNIPLFVLIASPWAACMFRDVFYGMEWGPRLAKIVDGIREASREITPFERVERYHLVSMLTVFLLAVLFASGRPGFVAQFEEKQFPIEAVPGLADLSKSRIFTYDQWSDYLIYRFPGARVFMDGRSDFYGAEFVNRYLDTINAAYNWESELKGFAIDTVVLKPDAPLATVLKQSPNWRLLIDNGAVIAFVAGPSGHAGSSVSSQLQFPSVLHRSKDGLGTSAVERVSD